MSFRAVARVSGNIRGGPVTVETYSDNDEFVLSPNAAYNETLHDLSLEEAMRNAGQTVMRADITPEEHALLLAVRELRDAEQAYEDANAAEDRARIATAAAQDAMLSAQRAHDTALYEFTHPASTDDTGEGDCS